MSEPGTDVLLFLLVYSAYFLLFYLLRDAVPFRPIAILAGICAGVFVSFRLTANNVAIYSLISTIFLFVSFYQTFFETIQLLFMVMLVEECIAGIVRCVAMVISRFDMSHPYLLWERISVLLVYLVVFCIRKHLRTIIIVVRTRPSMSAVFIVFMAYCMTSAVAVSMRLLPSITSPSIKVVILISLMLAYVGIGCVALFYSVIVRSHRLLQEHLQIEQLNNQMISDYYNALLQKESDTRQFRHDTQNHLMGLDHYLSAADLDGAKQYLQSMQGAMAEIQASVKTSGNPLADAILNRFRGFFKDPEVICVRGLLSDDLSVDPYHFNTILANLLQNATEAVLSLGDAHKDDIVVSFSVTRNFLTLSVKNRYSASVEKTYLYAPDKTRRHGYGLKNIEKSVRTLGGEMEITRNNDYYQTTVSIPLLFMMAT